MKTNKSNWGHNGDVEFLIIDAIPAAAKPIENRPMALGEVSGHAHVITGDVAMFEHEGKMYAKVGPGGARIQHVKEELMTKEDWASTKELHKADHGSTLLEEGTSVEFGVLRQYNPYKKRMEETHD